MRSCAGSFNVKGTYFFRTEQKSPKSVNLEGVSPLFVAAAKCNLNVAKYLLLKGAHVNCYTGIQKNSDFSRMTPIHAALYFSSKIELTKRQRMLQLLLQNGADLSVSTGGSLWTLSPSSIIELMNIVVDIESTGNLKDKITSLELAGAMIILREEVLNPSLVPSSFGTKPSTSVTKDRLPKSHRIPTTSRFLGDASSGLIETRWTILNTALLTLNSKAFLSLTGLSAATTPNDSSKSCGSNRSAHIASFSVNRRDTES